MRNTGAAFSFLSEAGGWQRWFFTIIAVAISCMLAVWLAHHRLQPLELKVRTVTLEALVSDQLSDLDLTADLQRMQDDMKAMATLIPDATLAMDIRKYTAQMLLNMLQQHSVFAKTLNAPLSQILFSLPPGLKPQQPIIQAVLWDVVCSRPAGQRAAALAPFRALIAQGKGSLLLDAPKRCAARLKFMLPAPLFYDALCLMVKEAIEPDARPLDEIIDTHSDQAGDLYNTALNAARRATMEAVAAGVNLGDKTTSSVEALLAFYRDRELSNRMRTRNTLQLARSRKNTAPGQQTEQEKAQTAVIQAWSLQQVAQWIEGPIAPPKAKPVPIVLFGTDYWKRLLNLDLLVEEGTISEEDLKLFVFLDDPQLAWEHIMKFYDLPQV